MRIFSKVEQAFVGTTDASSLSLTKNHVEPLVAVDTDYNLLG